MLAQIGRRLHAERSEVALSLFELGSGCTWLHIVSINVTLASLGAWVALMCVRGAVLGSEGASICALRVGR